MMTDSLSGRALKSLQSLSGVRTRKMFGGTGIFHSAVMFGLISDNKLYFRTGATNVAHYLKQGQTPYIHSCFGTYFALPYYSVPIFVQLDEGTLAEWAEKAMDVSKQPAQSSRKYFAKWTEFNVRPTYQV